LGNTVDPAFVDNVVQQVIAALREQGVATGFASRQTEPGASGPVLRSLGEAGSERKTKTSPAPPAVRKVFITAEMLMERLALNGHGGAIELACNEFLTPNARDVVDRRHMTVKKAPAPSPIVKVGEPSGATGNSVAREGVAPDTANARTTELPVATQPVVAAAGGCTFGLVVDGSGPKLEGLLRAMGHDSLALADYSRTACWMTNTREMCDAIAVGQLAGGVAILPHAAEAMVLANKHRGIRAVQGTRPASVEAGVRRFNANLLIVEHAFSTFHEMRQMVRLFVGASRTQASSSALMDAVGEMERP